MSDTIIPPSSAISISIVFPTEGFEITTEKDFWVNISISTNKDLPWASAGHIVAFEQFFLPSFLPHSKDSQVTSTQSDTHSAGLKVTEEEDTITVAGGGNDILFVLSKKTGGILHLGVEGKPSVITSGGGPCTWRALTDNDGPANESKLLFCHIHADTHLIPTMYLGNGRIIAWMYPASLKLPFS